MVMRSRYLLPMVLHFSAATVCLLTMLAPNQAEAFRCSQALADDGTPTGVSLSWHKRDIPYVLQQDGTQQLPLNQTFNTLRQAFAIWQSLVLRPSAGRSCDAAKLTSDVTFTEQPLTSETWVGYDYMTPHTNFNGLVFRDDAWPQNLYGSPAAADAIALTTTTYSTLTGEIFDADIEFNSADFKFSFNPNADQVDLLSTAVHEIGHFIGLAHCTANPNGVCGNGEVMEPLGALGDTSRRALACDDRAGFVFKYPGGGPLGYASSLSGIDESTCVAPVAAVDKPEVGLQSQSQGRGCSQADGSAYPCIILTALSAAALLRRLSNRKLIAENRPADQKNIAALIMLILTSAAAQGCTDARSCDGRSVPHTPGAPRILDMQLVGPIQIDPWRVVLSAELYDADGDMAAGNLSYFAHDSTTPHDTHSVGRLLSSSGGLDPNSEHAVVQTIVRFDRDTSAGTTLELGVQVTDAHDQPSNCYRLALDFGLSAQASPH